MANIQLNCHGKFDQFREHQKPNGNEFNQAEVEEKTITNIYYDCLERIFDFLDLKSLLMVAQTCKRLQIAAAAKFGDLYGKEHIMISTIPIYGNKNIEILYNNLSPIQVRVIGLRFGLPFLRCFGSKIQHLYVRSYCRNGYVDQYVNQYCAETVTRLESHGQDWFSFTKPFKKVEKLRLCEVRLRNEFPNLVERFPKLRCLEISGVYKNSGPFGVFFPQLEQIILTIDGIVIHETLEYQPITGPNARERLTRENAEDLLRANPQLSYVEISSWELELNMTTLLDMISSNPSISTLRVERKTMLQGVTMDEMKRLTSEHRSLVDLALMGFKLTCAEVIYFIRQLKSLKKVYIDLKNRFEYDRLLNQMGDEWQFENLHPLHVNVAYTKPIYVTFKR